MMIRRTLPLKFESFSVLEDCKSFLYGLGQTICDRIISIIIPKNPLNALSLIPILSVTGRQEAKSSSLIKTSQARGGVR